MIAVEEQVICVYADSKLEAADRYVCVHVGQPPEVRAGAVAHHQRHAAIGQRAACAAAEVS